MLRELFRTSGHEVSMAADGIEALASIAEREPDLVILDHSMPRMSGLEVCRQLKANPFTARIPIMMLTAQSGVESKVEGFSAGADDYIAKPFDPRELRARVQAMLRLVKREGDRNPTSGLPGGRAIEAEILGRIQRGESFAVCYLDLDNFKPFADTFGFAIADDVIRALGSAIRDASAEVSGGERSDVEFVGHIGGDDFIVITTAQRAGPLMELCSLRCREVVQTAVGPEAARVGTYAGVDREGRVRDFPLAGASAAVLHVTVDAWVNLAHLGMRAAEVKRRAKQKGSGTVLIETA